MPWDQWLILVAGAGAVGLSQMPGECARWACIVGLVGQVGWFHASVKAKQWGIFLSCFLYSAMWGIGLWQHWIHPLLE